MEPHGEMQMHKLKLRLGSNEAVAGVIEALLMVALVAVVLSIIQLQYIPQVINQREADHMDQVSNQFSTLKSMIDLQLMTSSEAPIFSMITLGSTGIPYFITAEAEGTLHLVDEATSRIEVGGVPVCTLTSIEYNADNSYFVDQTYAIEGGGIIVAQPEGNSTMRVAPQIDGRTENGRVKLYFDLVNFVCYKNKDNSQGIGKCYVRTNYSHESVPPGSPYAITGALNVSIYTQYPHAWYDALNSSFGDVLDIQLVPLQSPTHVQIKQKTDPIDLYLTEYTMYVQIGYGWIK